MADPILIRFAGATVRRVPGGEVVRNDLNWTIRSGDAWAIVGSNGSGKSTLAELLAGIHRISDGIGEWPIATGHTSPSAVISRVGFREDSRGFNYRGKYYQQRYEFIAGDDDPITLRSYLGFRDDHDVEMLAQFQLLDLIDQPFVTLSNGQTRKARIVKALLNKPRMLILDDPYVGLDSAARVDVNRMLGDLHHQGIAIVLIGSSANLPDWITHQFSCSTCDPFEAIGSFAASREPDPAIGSFAASREPDPAIGSFAASREPDPILELNRVSVRHGGVTLLHELSWTVRRGERWAIVGPNGSGKTTLLSLLCGDHPQAFSQDVQLFGRRRGSGESIWDVKARVGLVSPEWHLYFTEPLTARQTIATGFFDTVSRRSINEVQLQIIQSLAEEIGFSSRLDQLFQKLSSGEQRLILLARSLVKKPELLIWDEPFQCLDESVINRVKQYLARNLTSRQTMLIVSHDPRELPVWIDRKLTLPGRQQS